jgi:hypothetical protein
MPSANGANGELTRSANGQFAKGNCGGPGNPNPRRTAELQAAIWSAVTSDDLQAILRSMVQAALAGDVAAAKLILDRMFGKQSLLSMMEEAERIEQRESHSTMRSIISDHRMGQLLSDVFEAQCEAETTGLEIDDAAFDRILEKNRGLLTVQTVEAGA